MPIDPPPVFDDLPPAPVPRGHELEGEIDATLKTGGELVAQARQGFGASLVERIEKLFTDAEMLRVYAVRKNRKSGSEEVFNPLVFDRAIVRARDSIITGIRAMREIQNLQSEQDFYRSVMYAIMQESPNVRRRMINRLTELNTPFADIVRQWPDPPTS